MTTSRVRTPQIALLLAGILLMSANTRAPITSVGPVIDDIARGVGLSSAAAGLLASVPLVGFALFSPVAPAVARRLGLEATLWLSLVVLALGVVLRSLPVTGMLWVGTVLLGAAIAFMNVLLPSIVKRDFPGKVPTVTGAYTTTQSIAAAIASGIAVPLALSGAEGWRLSLGIWAGFAVLAAAVFAPQLRRQTTSAESLQPAARPQGLRSPWRTAMGWQLTVFMGLQSLLFYVVIAWLPSIEASTGVPEAEAGFHLFLFQIVAIAGNVLAPVLLHRLRDQRAVTVGATALAFIAMLGILLVPQLIVLWVALGGLGAGSTLITAISLFGLRTRHHEQTAVLSGMAQSVGYLLAAVGPVLIGTLHDHSGGWQIPLVAVCVSLVIQGVFAYLAGRPRWVE